MSGVDMNFIGNAFNSSLIDEDDIDLRYYLQAYDELYRLCSLLGTLFGFVGSEIMSKMTILRELKENDKNGNFNSMKSMISYEQNENLLRKSDYVSGSRTLLRLHRGLAFISLFLTKVNDLGMEDSTSEAGKEAYETTLAHYHSWLVRSGAAFAMYSLPTKETLLNRVCPQNVNQCISALPEMLNVIDLVYNRVQCCYEDLNLLDLP